MKALLIAGGFGTRLRPLTYTRPKHLLPIANEPHLHHVFDLLQRHGVDEAVLLTSYLAETFGAMVEVARSRGMKVEIAHEAEPLGTAGALKNAAHLVGEGTFFAFNGDILTDADLGALMRWHRDRRAEATIVLTPVEDPSAFGVVPTTPAGRVEGFIEKPPPGTAETNLVNAGIYIFEPSILERIPEGEPYSAERDLFPRLVEEGARLFATGADGYWMDIGTPEKYLNANLDALRGAFPTPLVEGPGQTASAVADDAVVDPSARITSACVGSGCSVAAGAVVERSVLLPGVTVGEGARVTDSILGEGVRVTAGANVDRRTLADKSVVEVDEDQEVS
jgi:NDP-sugar pyrophosphorylase family protein